MGTCGSKRNLKYFLSFLLMTGVHAVVTAIICGAYFAAVTVNIDTFDSVLSLERNIGLLLCGCDWRHLHFFLPLLASPDAQQQHVE